MPRRIVYTRHDGGVAIVHPAAEVIAHLNSGDFWKYAGRGFADRQIESQVTRGVDERAARRYVKAMLEGGCTDAEALDIIRDRDCGHLGTAFELWDVSAVPTDRWFRDAWRRSHNGGPIYIDMTKARRGHLRRLRQAARRGNATLQWGKWRDRCRKAATPHELRDLWPKHIERT